MANKMMMGKGSTQKGGYRGNQMWGAHRLEGSVKNFGSRAQKKSKKAS